MDFNEFKLNSLGIDKNKFGKIYSFVDFGNVNYWFENDRIDAQGGLLPVGDKMVIDIKKLAEFTALFSERRHFYFGLDLQNKKSIKIISKARQFFDKVATKPIQQIRHYLNGGEEKITTRSINKDKRGDYILIPKCNFDVEICIDVIRFLENYDTFCLFSGDADFVSLCKFLKRKNKKIIIFNAGHVLHTLKKEADLNINAQKIKADVVFIKHRTPLI